MFSDVKDPLRLGLIFLSTDITGPAEAQRILANFPNLVSISTNCVFKKDDNCYSKENYQYAADRLDESINLLRPTTSFHVVGVSCTSWCFAVGVPQIRANLAKLLHPETRIVDMATSIFTAAKVLNLKTVNLFAPYKKEFITTLIPFLAEQGITVAEVAYLGLDNDLDVWKVPPETIKRGVIDLMHTSQSADGSLICCSALRILQPGFIDSIERNTGKPVVSSMQGKLILIHIFFFLFSAIILKLFFRFINRNCNRNFVCNQNN